MATRTKTRTRSRHKPRRNMKPRITYVNDYPWIQYRYWMPDLLCWILGFTIIRSQCFICGYQTTIWKWLWGDHVTRGHRQHRAYVAQHEHKTMRYQPMTWCYPAANYRAYKEWRARQHSQNGLG